MVKEVQEIVSVDQCSAEAFFRLVYLDCSLLRRFHAQINNDESAIVPPWDHTRKRDVTFRTPVAAPALIQNLIKADCINVVESQNFTILPTGSIKLESTPVPQIPGASNFSSIATILIENIPQFSSLSGDGENGGGGCCGCSVTATVTVTASGPWGLTSTIESFMATAAQQSLRQFLGFCCQEINELQKAGALHAALANTPSIEQVIISLPVLPPTAPETPLQEDEDAGEGILEPAAEFYDAEEAASAMLDLAGLPAEDVNDVLALSLKYLFKSVDENTAILRSIDARLERLEQKQNEVSTWWNTLEKVWERLDSVNSRQMILLAGVAVTSAGITSLFYKSRYRNSSSYY